MQKGKPTAAEVQPLSRQPLTAYHGLTRGVCRTALLLMLASWLGGCDAAGTICSRKPTICDGTFGSTYLCASLPAAVCYQGTRAAEGSQPVAGVRKAVKAVQGDREGGLAWVGGGGGGEHAAHLPPSVNLLPMDAPPPPLLLRRPSRRSLGNNHVSGSVPSQLGRLTNLRAL